MTKIAKAKVLIKILWTIAKIAKAIVPYKPHA